MRLDGAPATAEALAPVLAALAVRGPDRADIQTDGPAALGHALLATTPEAAAEPMPLRHSESGCMITADARLDNRAELIAALGIDAAGRVIGDGALILAAYLRWGDDCPARLLGDFAFAIWDGRTRRLFAARDKAGMRQLIWHITPGRLFACATDPEALLHHPDVPRRINAARVADFIEQMEAIDHTSTFFEGLTRLLPAHALRLEGGAVRVQRYWQLAPTVPLSRASAADNTHAFTELFTQAVRDRLRSPAPIGSMLSGGIDSGAVTATAARLLHQAGAPPLLTFSAIDSDPACRESAGVRAAIDFIDAIDPRIASLADPAPFRDRVAQLTRDEYDPFDGHMAMVRALYVTAQQAGVRVMLDGVSGDTTLPTGDMVAYHLAQGSPRTAWAEARAQERFWSGALPAGKSLRAAVQRTFLPGWLHALRQRRWDAAEARRAAQASLVHPDLAARVDLVARRRANARHLQTGHGCDPATQARRMLHPFVIVARERYDRVAAQCGIEPRDPFLDVRLLEFCLTLPPEQIHANGWPKLILRRATESLLPDAVRWKTGRDHVGWRFAQICGESSDAMHDPAALLQLDGLTIRSFTRESSSLQCNKDGVASETDLIYLSNWITRVKSFLD